MTEPMNVSREERIRLTEELYDQIPSIECKGLCWNACGPIDASTLEAERMAEAGHPVPQFTSAAAKRWQANLVVDECPALGDLNPLTGRRDCLAYELRPIICRLWGVIDQDSMRCKHGCTVNGPLLTNEQAYDLIGRSIQIGGHPVLSFDDEGRELMKDMLGDPVVGPLMRRFTAGEIRVERELEAAIHARFGNRLPAGMQ